MKTEVTITGYRAEIRKRDLCKHYVNANHYAAILPQHEMAL
jgi:hypothetical protein